MSIKDKLEKLNKTKPAKANIDDTKAQAIEALRRRVDAVVQKNPLPPPRKIYVRSHMEETLAGKEVVNECGRFFLVEEIFKKTQQHGKIAIGELANVCTKALSLLAKDTDIAKHNITDAIFIDLETTGLAGGTGTFPFMIGIGWFDGNNFILQQLFSRDHSEEKASLTYLLEMANDRRFVVTFNGKTYDMGLLTTRLILNRLRNPLADLPHLDLLHPCRRIFKHRLENCTLSNIEAEILQHYREGDIPGFEIPQRYFDWLRRRDPSLVVDIFYHNRLDIISMAGIALLLSQMCDSEDNPIARDDLHITKLKMERDATAGDTENLKRLAESSDTTVAIEAMALLANAYKKNEQWMDAVSLWQKILSHKPNSFFAVEELAKHYEHQVKDYWQAINEIETFTQNVPFILRAERESLQRRLTRLRAKIANKTNKHQLKVKHEKNPHC
ncbi:MAG: ribonuclease H-like domain-containing protein [Deltaproteobacteria bacterium]